ncbi:hypothetical protein AX774_g3524 [Zancudomyces culisetae]|uniref:Octanoyltransferase n=1 Tax=Zancudomyces culisetae TaxID=1213189 RepID=A0A1R1PPR7_ZANCU|nr:hypothetical protein AX774_g3524 [Zancudomyces culisetae]|eukprot:OMH82975.1 hypothetical protein AX774_g3524 [Zancudomyces culisetae]
MYRNSNLKIKIARIHTRNIQGSVWDLKENVNKLDIPKRLESTTKESGNSCGLSRNRVERINVGYIDLGKVGYKKALDLQAEIVKLRTSNEKESELAKTEILLFVEHDPVYTNGIRNRGKLSESDLQEFSKIGAEYYEVF